MKRKMMNYITNGSRHMMLALLLTVLCCAGAKAQTGWDRTHFIVDWQMNAPTGTDFADRFSGWGMNFEGKYDVAPHWSVGAFISFHTNHRYVGRQTLPVTHSGSLTTDQQQSAFQLPFGLSAFYNFISEEEESYVKPYFGVKVGAMYMQNSIYNSTMHWYERPWGFYASPELGMTIHPVPYSKVGFHVAVYYSYGTNESNLLTYPQDGRNNVGVRVGVCF